MSHIATVTLTIKSLEALKRACQKLGLRLNLGQQTFKWFGTDKPWYQAEASGLKNGIPVKDYGKCRHAISIPGNQAAYEIGVIQQGNDLKLALDWYDERNGLGAANGMCEKVGGAGCETLIQEYAVQVAEMEAQELLAQGWTMERIEQTNGDVQIVLEQ